MYTSDANVYDSYGEALMLNGEYELAIKNFEKSIELNPENKNAVNMIQEIKQKINDKEE